jgi:hypothetical protein
MVYRMNIHATLRGHGVDQLDGDLQSTHAKSNGDRFLRSHRNRKQQSSLKL